MSHARYNQLCDALEGTTITRQARRRLAREGLLTTTGELTSAGLSLLLAYAPRSRWAPPQVAGDEVARLARTMPPRLGALTAVAMLTAFTVHTPRFRRP